MQTFAERLACVRTLTRDDDVTGHLTSQDICPITFNFGRTKTNITKFGRTYIRHKLYISHETSMYSHSGATLSKMLECLVNFIAKCKLSEFAIGFCHSKKMYVTFFLCDRTNVRSHDCSDICQI